jgi:nucleotide-binding universal stress UspA family protein
MIFPDTRKIHVQVVEAATIAHAIEPEAKRLEADLIVMGTHGRTGLAHVLMRSSAESMTRRAPCPVLTVPRRAAIPDPSVRREAIRHPPIGSF